MISKDHVIKARSKSSTTKFGGQKHCSIGDMMLLVIELQDSTCSLKSAITIHLYSTRQGITCHVILVSLILFTHILDNERCNIKFITRKKVYYKAFRVIRKRNEDNKTISMTLFWLVSLMLSFNRFHTLVFPLLTLGK